MKLKRVQSNLLEQNVFVRDSVAAKDLRSYEKTFDNPRYYYELEEVTEGNGIKHRIVTREYPITPEYLDSQLESCDYKLDPAGAIARSPKRVNLGDITDAQKLDGLSSSELEALRDYFAQCAIEKSEAIKPPFAPAQNVDGANVQSAPVVNTEVGNV
ncbi:hypothetical protein [Dipodfec virus UOA04_Rod_690]|nr:hypothetical protein [Dipodfec virus UOA04_Rod_690]